MENKVIKAGTKIVIGMYAGFAGTDHMDAYILVQDYTSKELDAIAWQEGLQWAEHYGVYPLSDDMTNEEAESDECSENIEGWWKLYDEKEHAGKCMYGVQDEPTFTEL